MLRHGAHTCARVLGGCRPSWIVSRSGRTGRSSRRRNVPAHPSPPRPAAARVCFKRPHEDQSTRGLFLRRGWSGTVAGRNAARRRLAGGPSDGSRGASKRNTGFGVGITEGGRRERGRLAAALAAAGCARQLPTDLSSGTCRSGAMSFYAFLFSSRPVFAERKHYCRPLAAPPPPFTHYLQRSVRGLLSRSERNSNKPSGRMKKLEELPETSPRLPNPGPFNEEEY